MEFIVIPRNSHFPDDGKNTAYLKIDHWNDYSYVTMFDLCIFDNDGNKIEPGAVKIGFVGQTTAISTHKMIGQSFNNLSDDYFSVGQDVNYYLRMYRDLEPDIRESVLSGLRDIAFDENSQKKATGEDVYKTSLLRSVSQSTINGQYRRVINGGAPLSDFDFGFFRPQSDSIAGVDIKFFVSANSLPSTNVHTIIGRNGVGKTSLLNEMITASVMPTEDGSLFYYDTLFGRQRIPSNYFSSLISVSFSAFDPFAPPEERSDPELGTKYYYVGLKDAADSKGTILKSVLKLREECVTNLLDCFSNKDKRLRWQKAIATLESDENFAVMNLVNLPEVSEKLREKTARHIVARMSSGHAIVLLTISRLVAKVEEKTLVLIDEPESHLHPPLLSAFTRALNQLLHNRNGVAIIATHSPVVLQEVPRSCARIITRSRISMQAEMPRIETFGENVGVLTREVFGLEVTKSGFHSLLEEAVREGGTYDYIVEKYSGQIGLEAKGILRALIVERESEAQQ